METDSRDAAERFARELMPFITAGPQGTTGYAEGRPRVHPVFRYWPCLIARDAVAPQVEIFRERRATASVTASPSSLFEPSACVRSSQSSTRHPHSDLRPGSGERRYLYDIACARSGDKGTSANVGVIARSGEWWEFLRTWLTADRVASFFSAAGN